PVAAVFPPLAVLVGQSGAVAELVSEGEGVYGAGAVGGVVAVVQLPGAVVGGHEGALSEGDDVVHAHAEVSVPVRGRRVQEEDALATPILCRTHRYQLAPARRPRVEAVPAIESRAHRRDRPGLLCP